MESTKPVAYYAPDVAPPPPLIVPLAATDIIILQMPAAWALEPFPHDLKLLAKTLWCNKARFRPYLTEATCDHSGLPAHSHSATPVPSPSPLLPPLHIYKGKRQQINMPPPPSPSSMESEDEDSSGDKDGEDAEDDKEDKDMTIERLLILQPKGIRSLGLKQLGTELNWSDDSFKHLVSQCRNMQKRFSPSICEMTYVGRLKLSLPVEESPAAWKAFKCEASCSVSLQEERRKSCTNAAKKMVSAIQEAVSSRPVPRMITVKRKAVNIAQGPATGSSIPCRGHQAFPVHIQCTHPEIS
ncbi:hypothetical protein F5146DRAFT_1005661 [Armillaria mellea]|nr:hypothetical protein F5146DRAFT_1005661 [Armillaria mellea]